MQRFSYSELIEIKSMWYKTNKNKIWDKPYYKLAYIQEYKMEGKCCYRIIPGFYKMAILYKLQIRGHPVNL